MKKKTLVPLIIFLLGVCLVGLIVYITDTHEKEQRLLIIIIGLFLTISLLLSILTRVWLVAKELKNKYQIMAHTDSLTGIYNRYGFDELAEKMISKNPQTHFVAALLDIDDFKFINDIYGHSYGDRALKSLADSMKAFFSIRCITGKKRW